MNTLTYSLKFQLVPILRVDSPLDRLTVVDIPSPVLVKDRSRNVPTIAMETEIVTERQEHALVPQDILHQTVTQHQSPTRN